MTGPSKPLTDRLCRLYFRRRPIGATNGMVWANTASWVFRQKPHPRHGENGYAGFEVETRRHPQDAKAALENATGGSWEMVLLWSRAVAGAEGEGPVTGENPWQNGWPVTLPEDATVRISDRETQQDHLLTLYLTAIYRALGREIDILASDREAHRATIRMFLANSGLTAEQAHNAWVDRHVAEGWVPGRKFDPALRTHPQIKPFRDLPPIEAHAEEAGIAALRAAAGTETPAGSS